MNLPAALLLAVVILGPLTQVLTPSMWLVVSVVVLGLALWAGWRAVRAEVVVDSTSVFYRGILRTLTIPRQDLLAYTDYSRGLASWLGQDVPEVAWDAGNGTTRTARLWMFVLRADVQPVGGSSVRAVRSDLERTIRAAVAEAHRERKHRKPDR